MRNSLYRFWHHVLNAVLIIFLFLLLLVPINSCLPPQLSFLITMFFFSFLATDLVLRKVINFSDCTVCLDKRNASGKIEFYQDPLLYKCSFRTRLHFTYDNLNSKMPSVIKVGVFFLLVELHVFILFLCVLIISLKIIYH